jgi:hypothetical protein
MSRSHQFAARRRVIIYPDSSNPRASLQKRRLGTQEGSERVARDDMARRSGTEAGFAACLHTLFLALFFPLLAFFFVLALGVTASPAFASSWPLSFDFGAFNWSQSPLLLDLHQYGGFNDNSRNSPPGVAPHASVFSLSGFGALGRLHAGEQKFFADAHVAALDFAQDKGASRHDRQFDLGWDWRAGQACQGRLIATASDRQAETEDLAGPGLDTLRLRLIDQSGRCALYGAFGLVFAAGAASRRHTAASALALETDAVYGRFGLDYDRSQLDHAEASAKLTALDFPQGPPSAVLGDAATQSDLQLAYRRILSPHWRAEAMAGVGAVPAPNDGRQRAVGVYDAELIWTPTDAWRAGLSASRTLGAAVSILAAAQIAEAQRLSLSWRTTPKVTLTGEIARLRLESGPSAGLYGGSTLAMLSARAVYQLTPFTSLTTSLRHAERTASAGRAPNTVAMFGMDFNPF